MKKLLPLLLLATTIAQARPLDFFSTGEPYFAWEDKTISVCWLDNERIEGVNFSAEVRGKVQSLSSTIKTIDDETKQQIKTLINKEYTKDRTGIRFVGWKNCKDTSEYDVVLITGDSTKHPTPMAVPLGKANIGRCNDIRRYEKLDPKEKSYLYLNFIKSEGLNKISPMELIKLTAIHEFGHLAGLRHEHIRPEAKQDPSCIAGRLGEPMNAKTKAFSVYDPSSIMNYCFLDFVGAKAGLNFNAYMNKADMPQKTTGIKNLLFSQVAHYRDESIFELRSSDNSKSINYQVNIGLSQGDVHGLRCMYVFDAITRKKKCQETFKP